MYLKSIEIHGFKSFANKIVLDFNDGITGIVGPNGSGKSNIADAVRWVLGEQSAKQLRGYKMEDIIFSGTETRKPLGYAYVSISLDNSDSILPIDYQQVTVSRRVYRSGESEYLINGSVCRLKDVQELFLDTGIGKEGYSIIGQGQIDKILSGKPEDRRELFDEAAGIVKFKRRKALTQKSLEQEKQNLYRVTDIMNEIEGQLEPLYEQSERAKEYLKYKESQKVLEINLFLNEYERNNQSKNQFQTSLNNSLNDFEEIKNQFENTKEEFVKLETEIEKLDLLIDEKKSNHNDFKLKKEKIEGEINLLNNQIDSIIKNNEYQLNRIHTTTKEIDQKNHQKSEFQDKKSNFKANLNRVKEDINNINIDIQNNNSDINKIIQNIEILTKEILDLKQANIDCDINIQRINTIIEQSSIRKAEIHQEIIKLLSDKELYDNSLKELNEKYSVLDKKLKNTNKNIHLKEDEFNIISDNLNRINLELDDKHQSYLVEKSKLDSLINITERYDGYGISIRKVMEQRTNYSGIKGVVADIIKVDKKFETAIEIALGASIQNIITKDEETAKKLINYLKVNKFGRATFLPLTNINKAKTLDSHLLNEKGVLGIASELVNGDNEYKELIRYLLGRVLVVDHIDHASAIAKKYNYSLRIVTLEGEQMNPGGSISGGAYKNSSNLLGRRREIEELEILVKKLYDRTKILNENKIFTKEKREEIISELNQLKSEIQNDLIQQNTLKLNLESMESKIHENNRLYQELSNSNHDFERLLVNQNNEIKKFKQSILKNLEIIAHKQEQYDTLNLTAEKYNKNIKELEDRLNGLNIEFLSIEQNINFITENINRLDEEIDKVESDKDIILSEIESSDKIVFNIRNDIHNKNLELENILNDINTSNTEIQNDLIQKESIVEVHKKFFDTREELFERMNLLDKENYRLKTQIEKCEEQLNSQINYMWDEYELTYNLALEYKKDISLSVSQVKKQLNEIKNNIKLLGDVHVGAIEEYKVKSERFSFLLEQKNDIIKAEESLIEIIKVLEQEMMKQFEEHFSLLKKQFDFVFKEMFGGGKAGLELAEDDNILEAGIIINAQPPGKKLQNMMQLSGGEKALTAISLLFAIQNLKPSPFCLLDEIEAALDESNVKRFADYLKKLTKDTQFIIITHRRGTMAVADTLYGITMHEKGVSTLVSVNLIENELDQ